MEGGEDHLQPVAEHPPTIVTDAVAYGVEFGDELSGGSDGLWLLGHLWFCFPIR
jgi:hypothetical protein